MSDILFFGLTVLLLALSVGLVRIFDGLREDQS
jgi:hypothetical protein